MKALQAEDLFTKLRPNFQLVQVNTKNGDGDHNERLKLTRNNAYILLLDGKGREFKRFLDDAGESGASGKEPFEKITTQEVLDAMFAVREGKLKAITGTPLVARMLRDPKREIQEDGTWLVKKGMAKSKEIVTGLSALLAKHGPPGRLSVAWHAARALGKLGRAATPAAAELVALIDNEKASESDRQMALISLGALDPVAPLVLPTIRRYLEGSHTMALGAAIAAEKLGAHAAPLLPDMLARYDQLPKDEKSLRTYLATAILATGAPGARAIEQRAGGK